MSVLRNWRALLTSPTKVTHRSHDGLASFETENNILDPSLLLFTISSEPWVFLRKTNKIKVKVSMFSLHSDLALYPKPSFKSYVWVLVFQSRRVTLLTSTHYKPCTMLNRNDVSTSHLPRNAAYCETDSVFGKSRLCME